MRLVQQRDELKRLTRCVEERDSFHVLGLSCPGATKEEVKRAYRNLARKEHPDKAGLASKRRFQAIHEAYTNVMQQLEEGHTSSRLAAASDADGDGCEEAQ